MPFDYNVPIRFIRVINTKFTYPVIGHFDDYTNNVPSLLLRSFNADVQRLAEFPRMNNVI